MRHCDVLFLVLSSLCSLQAYNYAEHLYNIFSTKLYYPTHVLYTSPTLTCKEPLPDSRLMILHASELATELFDEVQSQRCMFAISIATAKLPVWSRHVHGITQ